MDAVYPVFLSAAPARTPRCARTCASTAGADGASEIAATSTAHTKPTSMNTHGSRCVADAPQRSSSAAGDSAPWRHANTARVRVSVE